MVTKSKFNKAQTSNAATQTVEQEVAKVQELVPAAKPAPKKSRKSRAYRVFNYRGITFFLIAKGTNTVVAVFNQETNTPEPRIEVPRADAVKAAQALAKIIITEQYLEEIEYQRENQQASNH